MRNICYLFCALACADAFAAESDNALEQRVSQLEAQLQQQSNTSASSSASAFNPAISLILSGTYAHYRDAQPYQIEGFTLGAEGAPKAEGFAVGESELTLSANIDDKFFGQTTVSFASENGETVTSVEETYVQTTAVADGLTVKFGRFLSGVGYLNGHHAHTDIFIDRPLVYSTFFDHHYGDDGVQLRYVLPTDRYIEVGAELMRGDAYPAANAVHQGQGVNTQYIHIGDDIGIGGSYVVGYSRFHAGATDLVEVEQPTALFYSGNTTIDIVDATFKWSPQGNKKLGALILRSEYFRERRDGNLHETGDVNAQDWSGTRNGYYIEGEYLTPYGFEYGLRFDQLNADTNAPSVFASGANPQRFSVMAGWRNSEFSRIQIQWSQADNADGNNFDGLMLQYQMALGAHGAHKY